MTPGFSLEGLSGPLDSIPSFLPSANASPFPSTTSTNPLGSVKGAIGQLGKTIYGTGNNFLNTLFGNNLQYLTGIIGLILIAAGIFLFRPVRETVVNIGKTAGAAAAKGAAAAAA